MKRIVSVIIMGFLLALLSACTGSEQSDPDIFFQNGETNEAVTESVSDSGTDQEGEESEDAFQANSQETAKLLYMGQASIRIITAEGKVIYIDPYVGDGYEPAADLILVTHSHYDHNGVERIEHRNADCQIITWKEALKDGEHQTFDLEYVTVEAVEAGYNSWHDVKECVGYVLTLSDGVSVYVTGDTSKTEQMPLLAEKEIDYAFYCCDGVFNMDLDEAVECAELVKAKHNIPYHVLAQDGVFFDRERAEQFNAENRLIIDEGEEIELKKEIGESGSMKIETYYLGTQDRIIAYLPDFIAGSPEGTVPMVLNLHWTSGTPEDQVTENGWLPVSETGGFIMIAPFYGSYDSVYRHTDYFAEVVRDAYTRYPMIDKRRVYVSGFSNGGAAAVALTDQYPEMFAAIAPEGWMVGMRDWSNKGKAYDMPFQIIQGSKEYTYETSSGAMAIMTDEQEALSDLMLFNEISDKSFKPDYYKDGYDIPFGELILVEDGIHWARPQHAQLAWDFMKQFRRNDKGMIEIVK